MAYQKQNFRDEDSLSAAQLEKIEEGILEVEKIANEKAKIDDNTVDTNAWSSKKIVDRLCPTIEENGILVQCVPVAGYPLVVVTEFAALQEGSGDPSPDNVRPIIAPSILGMGWWTGKNLYRYDRDAIEAGYVSSGGSFQASSNYYRTKPIPVSHLRGKTITLDPRPGGNQPAAAFFDDAGVGIAGAGGKGHALVVPNNASFMRFSINKEVVADEVDGETMLKENADVQIQLELGSKATDYEPFKEQNHFTVELPEYAACGDYDWNTGLLTVTHRVVDLSTLNWQHNVDNAYLYAELPKGKIPDATIVNDTFCNAFRWAPGTFCAATGIGIDTYEISDMEGGCCVVIPNAYEGGDTIDFLTEVQVLLVYPLEESYTVQYDPRQVLALDGVNYLAGGSGNTKVSGRADPAVLINSLLSRLADLEAAAVNNT